jgi:hypothetical protein
LKPLRSTWRNTRHDASDDKTVPSESVREYPSKEINENLNKYYIKIFLCHIYTSFCFMHKCISLFCLGTVVCDITVSVIIVCEIAFRDETESVRRVQDTARVQRTRDEMNAVG